MRQQFKIMWICALVLASLGVLQFLLCSTVAIHNYPSGFSFTTNYISELGRTATQYHTMFNASLITLGLMLIPSFIILWMTNFQKSWSMRAAAAMGVVSSLGLVGMGLVPVDREFFLHWGSLAMWLFPMLYMTISFFHAASRSPYVGIGFIASSLVTVIIMIAVLMNTDLTSLQLLHISVVFFGFVWLIYVIAYIAQAGTHILKNWDVVEDMTSKENAYFAMITQNNRKQ